MFNIHSHGLFQSRKLAITAAKSSDNDSEKSSVYEDLPPEGTEQFEYSGMAAPIAFDVCFRAEVLLNSGVSINSDELNMDKRSIPEYENPFKSAAPYFRKDKDNFQVKIPCYDWTFIVTNNDSHENNEQKRLVKLIFPDYKTPTMWKRDKEKGLVVNNSLLRSKTWHHKEFLAMTKSQNLVPPSGWPKKVPIHGEDEEDSGIDNNMEFYFEIIGSKLANTDTDHSESGSITSPTAVFIYTVRTHFFLSVPKKYAFWATESENEKEFIPRLFLMWASKQFSYFISPKGDIPNKVGSLTKIVKNNEERAKQYNFTPVPRINRERFTILRNGANIMWVPPENNVVDYNQKLRGSFNETTGEMPPLHEIPGFLGMHVLTDWMNDKLSFVNTAGNLQVVDLLGSHPLDDVTITRMLNTKLNSEKLQKYFELVDTRIVLDNRVGEFSTFKMQGMSHLLMAYDPEITIMDVGIGRINADLSTEQNAKFLQLCKNMIALAKKADIEIEKFRNESYMSRNSLLRVWNAMFGIYAPQGKTFTDEYSKALERNRFDTPPDGWKPKLSNMPGLSSLTPHQNKIVYNLQKFPKKVMYDVNPGGGKCLVGRSLVSTEIGLLSLKELRNLFSFGTVKDGFQKIGRVKVVSSHGMLDASHSFQRKGKTLRWYMSDGSIIEGLAEHKFWATNVKTNVTEYTRLDKFTTDHVLRKYIGSNIYGTNLDIDIPVKKAPSKLTTDIAMLLGLMVAEGCTPKKRYVSSFTNKDPEILSLFRKTITKYFGKNSFSTSKRKEILTYYLYGDALNFMRNILTLGTSKFQQAPLIIRTAPKFIQRAFLQALFEGDGTIYKVNKGTTKNPWINNYVVEYCSISPTLVYQVKAMLENMGVPCSVKIGEKYKSKQGEGNRIHRPYTLIVEYRYHDLFSQNVGFLASKKTALLEDSVNILNDLRSRNQSSNLEVAGVWNKKYFGSRYAQFLDEFSSFVQRFQYKVPVNANGGGGRVENYTLSKLWRDSGYKESVNRIQGDFISNYTIEIIDKVINSLPNSLSKAFERTDLYHDYLELRDTARQYWIYPIRKVWMKKEKTVYDLRVPGPQDYVVDNMLSHNTGLIIADIMTLLKNNKIKRPAVSVPDYLVGGFCDEVVDKSEGKINAFPVKVEILRRIYDNDKDEKSIIKMLQSLPSNTIIVLSHNATKSKTALDPSKKLVSRTYGTTTIDTFPILDMLKPVGIDYLAVDESSDARNLDSQVSKALQTLAATVEYSRIASGTIVLKSLADLPGQGALLTPAMYGDKESFEQIQESDNVEKTIHDVTYPYAAKYVAKKREWAFLLPKFNEHFYTPEHCGVTGLTDKQRAYYNYLLDDALDKVMEEIGKRRAKDGDVDDVNDQEIENAFRSHLQKVEQFLVNPSSTVAYTAQFSADHSDKEDLVSPKVRVVNEILKCHFGLPGANTKLGIKMDKANKVIVFGDHREASKHMMANIIRPDMCIHATAENKDEAVQEFKTNPSKMILVADGRGLGKGLNLQLASRVIFLEIEWAPGDLEQKIARIGRPDFKEIANRDSIDIDHVLVNDSIDFAKFGRLVSRIIDKSRFDEFGNPAYEKIIDQMSSLPLLRMNLKLIRDFSTETQLNDRGYIDSYRTLKTWEDDQFDKNREKLVEKFSRIKGKPVTLGQAKAMALTPVEHSPDIMGTRDDVYTPYVIGMTIPDRLGLGNCVPIRQVENIVGSLPPDRKKSKKDKEDDSLEDISVIPGEKVVTEFGPGTISSVLKSSVRVLVHGFGEVTLDKSIVHIPASQKGREQLAKALKNAGPKGLPFLKPEKLDSTYTKKFQDVEDTTPAKTNKNDKTEKVEKKSTVEEEKPTTKKSKNAHELIFIATSINGIMSICSYVDENAGEALDKANRSWNRVPAFLNMKIKTWQGGVRLMEFLTKNYSMESDKKNGLAKAIENYKKNKNRIVVTPTLFADTLNFFRVRHKKIPRSDSSKKQLIRPWYYVWEDELHVCFDITNHPTSVISQIKRAVPKLKNIATPSVEEGFVIKFFKSKDDALAEVNFFNNNPNFIISDVKEVMDDLNKLVVRKKTDKK